MKEETRILGVFNITVLRFLVSLFHRRTGLRVIGIHLDRRCRDWAMHNY
jgi:hypothetical protein